MTTACIMIVIKYGQKNVLLAINLAAIKVWCPEIVEFISCDQDH